VNAAFTASYRVWNIFSLHVECWDEILIKKLDDTIDTTATGFDHVA
jgi:hypothetical protein